MSLAHRPIAAMLMAQLVWPALAVPVMANDSIAELATGGLALKDSAEIALVSEDLRISPQRIEVDYVFRNRASRDASATVAFPMPDIGGPDGEMMAIPHQNENFLDFTVTQDGRPIQPRLEARAWMGDQEVTQELGAQGVPVIPLGQLAEARLASLPDDVKADWTLRGLIATEHYDDGTGWKTQYIARWIVRSTWYWQTTFRARSDVRVAHRYTPSVGGSAGLGFMDYETRTVGGDYAEDYRGRYCMDAGFEAAVNRMAAREREGMMPSEQRLSYVLGTGANWAGGRIGRFTLTVDKIRPDALVSFCGTNVTKIGPTTFRMIARDFDPPPVLDILIVTPSGG